MRALADPLSVREVTVLRYLCSRLTYREIAAMTDRRTFANVNKHLVKARAAIRRTHVS